MTRKITRGLDDMAIIGVDKDGYLAQMNWTKQTALDFLSDFCSASDEKAIIEKSNDIYQDEIEKGVHDKLAQVYADGYRQALLDIYYQIN